MNGQLSEQPLGELIREISAKSLAGKLQLQHDRVKVVVYFDRGEVLYAASNLRTLRLREYLLKAGIAAAALARYEAQRSDIELAKVLCADHLLAGAAAEQIQTKQVSDVLRLVLSWTEGTWEFDHRSRLDEAPKIKLDIRGLLLDAGRRMPPKFVASRFRNPTETILSDAPSIAADNLLSAEVFLLSRLDRPTPLNELIAISGVGENETLVLIYSLALAGYIERESWTSAPGGQPQATAEAAPEEPPPADETDGVNAFLEKLSNAPTHYDVLSVDKEASPADMKARYYELARRYHPDRFRKSDPSLLARIESAFARITQAYDTLRDDRLRRGYDAKLQARQKAQQLADSRPKPAVPAPPPTPTAEPAPKTSLSTAEQAELQFKEGLAALELGQRKAAIGYFASAANAVPNEPRYRALYGKLLAENEDTRRAAETELQAAVKLDPKNGEYRVLLAELYRDLGLTLRARGEAERALAVDPNNRKARELLRTLKSV